MLYQGPGPPVPPGETPEVNDLQPLKAVNVTPASKIQFLEGCRRYSLTHTGQYTTWIRVRIDSEEGWVPNEEMDKLGLPTVD